MEDVYPDVYSDNSNNGVEAMAAEASGNAILVTQAGTTTQEALASEISSPDIATASQVELSEHDTLPPDPALGIQQIDPSLLHIVKSLEDLFDRFNTQFFESALSRPRPVITVSPNPSRRDALGWFTSRRVWQDGQSDGYFEINICAEYLNSPFEDICSTLLHEMCHLYNVEHDINDTCRSGTYHNRRFKKTAEAHGLIVEKEEPYGYSKTKLAPEAMDFINTLEHTAFALYRQEPKSNEDQSTDCEGIAKGIRHSSTRIYKCLKCGTKIRATKEVRVRCEECNVLFEQTL